MTGDVHLISVAFDRRWISNSILSPLIVTLILNYGHQVPFCIPLILLSAALFVYLQYLNSSQNYITAQQEFIKLLRSEELLKRRLHTKSLIAIVQPNNDISFNALYDKNSYRFSRIIRSSYHEQLHRGSISSISTRPNSIMEFSSSPHQTSTPIMQSHRFSSFTSHSSVSTPFIKHRFSSHEVQGEISSTNTENKNNDDNSSDHLKADIQLTDLIDMDFDMSFNVESSDEQACNADDVMSKNDDLDQYTPITQEFMTFGKENVDALGVDHFSQDLSWHRECKQAKRFSLPEFLNDLDDYQQGLKSFKLTH